MAKRTIGRPFEAQFKEPARLDIRLEAEDKRLALENLPLVKHGDLSSYLRMCIKALASGRVIPELCGDVTFERETL